MYESLQSEGHPFTELYSLDMVLSNEELSRQMENSSQIEFMRSHEFQTQKKYGGMDYKRKLDELQSNMLSRRTQKTREAEEVQK